MMRSTSSPRAVSMMIGTCERPRSSRHSDRPSSPGSIRSSTSRSTCERSMTRRISLPSGTAVVRYSCFSRYCASRPRISRSSSTINRCGRSFIVPRVALGIAGYRGKRPPAAHLVPQTVLRSLNAARPQFVSNCCSRRRSRRPGMKAQRAIGRASRAAPRARRAPSAARLPLLRCRVARKADIQLEVARLGGAELARTARASGCRQARREQARSARAERASISAPISSRSSLRPARRCAARCAARARSARGVCRAKDTPSGAAWRSAPARSAAAPRAPGAPARRSAARSSG